MTMLLLTQADADLVRGLTVPGHALAPVPLKNGTFVLPMGVLDDPFHAARHTLLAQLDVMNDPLPGAHSTPSDVNSPIVGGDYSQDLTVLQACAYKSTWQPGKLIAASAATGT